ncbi:MAG: hypothetical protein J1F11_09640 [Oscillospiraceae bacterium]|nr:hypothetical protein [Oscillospiraceae bacterium]
MKEAVFKFFTAVFVLLIFWGMLHAMRLLSDINDLNYIKILAEKNTGLAADGPDIPAVSAKAPAEAMRTEPAPITAEDLSYIYLDGIKFDFPVTLAMLRESFELKRYYGAYNEDGSSYVGEYTLIKNGIGTYRIEYTAGSKGSPLEECIVTSITAYDHNEKYYPQLVIAGIDVFAASEEEYLHLADLDKNEYLMRTSVIYPEGNEGHAVFDPIRYKGIRYYKNDDPALQDKQEEIYLYLIKNELRLPENYDPDIVPAGKEETREFVHEYYDPHKNRINYNYNYYVLVKVDNFYLTAYEFLALQEDEYEAEYYEIESLRSLTDDDRNETGYLHIEARCHIKGYEKPVSAEMVLKAGEPLGNALIIN